MRLQNITCRLLSPLATAVIAGLLIGALVGAGAAYAYRDMQARTAERKLNAELTQAEERADDLENSAADYIEQRDRAQRRLEAAREHQADVPALEAELENTRAELERVRRTAGEYDLAQEVTLNNCFQQAAWGAWRRPADMPMVCLSYYSSGD
jgi:hypothetical protein